MKRRLTLFWLALLLSWPGLTWAQHTITGCESVEGEQAFFFDTLRVTADGHFLNSGTVHYTSVSVIVNDGGFSETGEDCMAVYDDPCDAMGAEQGDNVFDTSLVKTDIYANAPIRMYNVEQFRDIHLQGEWQILGEWDSPGDKGSIITDRTQTDDFVHFVGDVKIPIPSPGFFPTAGIDGYAGWTSFESEEGFPSLELLLSDDGVRGGIYLASAAPVDCGVSMFKAAFFAGDPTAATLPQGAPFSRSSLGEGIGLVSDAGYWDIIGQDSAFVVFVLGEGFFDVGESINPADLTCVGWTGEEWADLGPVETEVNPIFAFIRTTPFVPDDYQAFALGVPYEAPVITAGEQQAICWRTEGAEITAEQETGPATLFYQWQSNMSDPDDEAGWENVMGATSLSLNPGELETTTWFRLRASFDNLDFETLQPSEVVEIFVEPTDCDGDGIDDLTEAGPDPDNPIDADEDGTPDYLQACSPMQEPGYTDYNAENLFWLEEDCDGDGLTNEEELDLGTDPYNEDTDGDGVSDFEESCGYYFFWAGEFTQEDENTVSGLINDIGFTYTSSTPVVLNGGIANSGVFPQSYNVPPINPVIRNTKINNNTLTFDEPIENPVFLFSSVGSPEIAVSILFEVPVEVEWSQNVTQEDSTSITGMEGRVILRVPGTHTSIDFTYPVEENYSNFYFGYAESFGACTPDGVNTAVDVCAPAQDPGYTGYDADNATWAADDCDEDGLTNGEEVALGTDPYLGDTDGDGVSDSAEDEQSSDPLDSCDPVQAEGYEGYVSTNEIWATADCDADGLTNADELELGTDPYNADTDDDGVTDGQEAMTDSTDPLEPCEYEFASVTLPKGALWAAADCDGDGLTNEDEQDENTDTDGDGVVDFFDLDSDNDGILDSVEGVYSCGTGGTQFFLNDFGTPGANSEAEALNTSEIYNGAIGVGDGDSLSSSLIPGYTYTWLNDGNFDPGSTSDFDPSLRVVVDGQYAVISNVRLSGGGWGIQGGDHTTQGSDVRDGGMLMINGANPGEVAFRQPVTGLEVGKNHVFSAWVADFCANCYPGSNRPNLEFRVSDSEGVTLASNQTGQLFFPAVDTLTWTEYSLEFEATTPTVTVELISFAPAGGGNDFALDDISLRSCPSFAFVADIDGDGIPNHLDLDSDGDGCFDAVEASGDFSPAALDNDGRFLGGVDENGIPLAVLDAGGDEGNEANTPSTAAVEEGPAGLSITDKWLDDELFDELCGSDLGGFVWLDNDRNGLFLQQEASLPGTSSMPSSEEVLPGVQVRLYGTDIIGREIDTLQTADADGYYLFELVLAGDYCMEISFEGLDNAEDYVLTIPNVEFNAIDSLDSDYSLEGERCFTLETGAENVYDLNAGVFLDADGDFIPDVNDPDIGGEMLDPQGFIYCENSGEIISGATIEVTGPGNVTMVADGSTGFYQWFVDASGTYTMTLNAPAGYDISTDCTDSGQLDPEPGITIVGSSEEAMSGFMEDASCGANPFYMEFVLSPGDLVLNNNLPLVCAEIGDRAWKDFDRDGLQSPGEPGLGFTEVRLLDCSGNGVDTVVSDIEGRFLFTGLPAGGYVLDYEGRAEWAGSLPNLWSYAGYQAGAAELDSDITASGSTECVTLGVGEKNYTVDGGYEVPYTYSCNCDGSITLEWSPISGEPGVTYTVDIEDSAGNPVLDYVNMTETSVTIAHGTLQNGEEYRLAITENISTSNVVSITGPLYADCNPVPMASVISAAGPACPGGTDGSVLFELEESGCAGRYAVYLEQAGSDILVAADTTLANSFSVSGLGEGSYSLRVELLDTLSCGYGVGCFPLEVEDFVVLSNQDMEGPSLEVSAQGGVGLGSGASFTYTPPEGECGVQLEWLAVATDNCSAAGSIPLSVSIESDVAGVSPWATVTVAPLSSQGSTVTSVYLLSSGDASNDNLMVAQLESTGRLSVTLGEEFWEMDGTEDLSAYDVVFLQANFNWNNPLSAEAAANLTAYVENGGGLVTSEWSVWNAAYNTGSGSWDALLPILPVDLAEINGEDYLGEADVTYTSVNSEPLVNDGLSSSFVFTPSDASGTVSLFTAKAGATVFYDMAASYDGYDYTAVGMAGWAYQSGRVFSFNGTNGATEIANDANLRQLLINALNWSSGQTETVVYSVSLHAGIGTNTVVLTATDEAGNSTELSYEITVVDSRAPEIYGPGDMQVQIPGCEDSAPVNWQVSAIDDCSLDVELEQISGPQPGDVLAPGTYTVVYEATDGYGNTSQYSFDITLTQAQSPAPIVDVSGNGQFVIEDCAEDGFIVFSGHIYDCELQPGDVPDGLISISGAPLEITYILVNEGYAYFEATGNLSAGSYLIVTSYEGVTIGHAVEVVQDPDTPAVITMPGNLAYQVPNCEGEAAVSFAVQLEDDCDEDFGTASFTVNGAPAPPFDATLSGPANGYFAWSLSLPPGVYTIVGTYTDGGGNTTEATATITVNADEDNSAPIIVYPSQNITEELDPCGPDEAEICFQATAIDDCEGDIVPTVTVTGPGGAAIQVTADGTTYCFTAGPGQYTVSIGAVDAAGNSTSEAFGVSVTQDDAPEANLACNDDINVTLDENCSRVITADMVLEGNFGCLQEDDFAITIVNDDNPANGNILDGHGQWIYEIDGPDVAGFEPCWGFITGEDKTAPVVDCPDDTDVATISESVQKIQGALETTDAQLELADYSCFLDGAGPVAGGQYYDIIEFQVSADDIYTIYLNTSWGDGFTALYQGSFDADSPCENILYAADDNILGNAGPIGGLFDPQVRVTLPLRAYETYFVLVSSFGSDVTGSYEHTIFSDGNGLVGAWNFTETMLPDWTIQYDTTFSALPSTTEQLSIPLFCDDFGQIYGGDAGSVAQETAFISGTYQWVGAPSATDNCDDNVDITATDSFTSSGDCGDVVITRTFTAIDDQGLTDECQQQITIRKPTLDDVNFPSFTAVVECDEDFPTLANGNPAPELTGYPFIFTAFGIFDIAPNYCNIGASYEDLPTVDECEGRFKFRREWTIFDWCDPGSSLIANQLIKVGDYTAPEVSCPAGTPIAYSTSPFSCGASFEVPMPSVSDNCSNVTVYTEIVTTTEEEVINQYGLPTGQFVIDTVVVRTIQPGANRFVSSIPFGGHFFRYVAEDDCGNETELYCPFSVIDEIEPVAVCDDQLNVSIGGGNIVPGQPALARVFASDVDEGSWDNCGDVSIAIFRNNFNPVTYTCGTQNSVTGDFVDFFCCDVGVTSDITLVVTDQYGNQNSCWLSVTPEDKINPFCDAPDNVVVDCDGLPYGFDASDADQLEGLFGMATGADNCGVADVQQVAANADLECGYGSITRIFRVTDVNGLSSTNSCVQVITINEVHNYEIYFPEDAEANCGTPTPDTVEYNELGCDLLAVTSSDEQFSASGDECYKIFRTWKVINWCQYDGESDPYIVGRDEDCNGTPGDGDRIANNGNGFWLLARPNGKIYFDQDTDETPSNNVPGFNFCGTSNDYYDFDYDETGYYQYTQIIKVYDDTAPEISFTAPDAFCSLDNVNCDANVTYPFSIEEDCTPDDLTIKVFLDPFLSGDLVELTGVVSGSYPDYTITVNGLPIGSHAFEVHVLDGCGNSDLAILPFDIIDCKAPAPFCLNGIAIELMPVDEDGDNLPDPGAGMAEIWASDFVASPITDCSEPIKYSINRAGEPNGPDQTGLVLTCDDEGTLVIEIWAYDAAGNSDFCETYILVQDNMGVCGGSSPLAAGAVNTENNEPVEQVEVSLSGQASTAMTTQNDGAYVFTNLTSGLDYTITPQRDGDYLNGVSTFDLVLISKHILGVGPLSTPYQRIAADVNNSGSITTLDLIQLRKLILSIDTEFANNTSWRFVEEAYVFPDPSNPWAEQFPEVININDLPATSITDADFVAVKIGDVNGDATANSFAVVDERSYEGAFALQTDEQELKAGNEYRVSFTAAELARIEGYQATLTLSNGVELVDIVSGVATEDNFGLAYLGEGMITTSWHWASGASAKAPTGIELFTLVLRANSDVMLSEVLGVSSAVTKAEAYGKDGSFQDVAIEFGSASATASADRFELYQNQPNPFKGETVIGFNLPEAAQVTITISDVTGKVLKLYRQDGSKGYNHITVKSSELAATGVVQYTVSTGTHSATKHMVIVE